MLALAVLGTLLSGCVYIKSNAEIHDDGSGTVTLASGMLLEDGEEPEAGKELFEANGKRYQGERETYSFRSAEEFNQLFAPDTEDGPADSEYTSCLLNRNSDGSLTLVFRTVAQDAAEEAGYSEEEIEMAKLTAMAMRESAYLSYSFAFDRPLLQLAGPAEAVALDGGRLALDLGKVPDAEEDVVFVFVTDVASAVVPTQQSLRINGEEKEAEVYNINGANYFKLRDMAALLSGTGASFSVDYDDASRTVSLKTGEAYRADGGELLLPDAETAAQKAKSAVRSTQALLVNGEAVYLAPYNIGGNNYFALRELGSALGFGVDYDDAARAMLVTTE